MRIDLHTHTVHSDGTDTPAQLIAAAQEAGLDVVGLTDHDTISGWGEAASAARRQGIALVRGAEISTRAAGISVHVLSYLHDPDDAALAAMLSSSRSAREVRARRMVENLARDFPISWQDVAGAESSVRTIGRPHMADALVAAGVVADRYVAFERILHARGPYYVPIEVPDPHVAVGVIRDAGGVPVMAHPLAAVRGRVVPEGVIEEMVEAGLAALEADHRDHDDDARARVRELAARWGIPVTGSSDYHGHGKLNRLGENVTERGVYEALMSQGRMEVV